MYLDADFVRKERMVVYRDFGAMGRPMPNHLVLQMRATPCKDRQLGSSNTYTSMPHAKVDSSIHKHLHLHAHAKEWARK